MAPAEARLRIELAWSPAPRQVRTVELMLPEGSTVADALRATAWIGEVGPGGEWRCGVWGRVQTLDHPLRDGDRVEVYRPLKVDPKEARRLRYKRQRAR